MVTVADKIIIKSINKEASQDKNMVYVKTYFKSGNLTKEDRELCDQGGEDVAN